NTTSLIGWPVMSMTRPPTWNEPMSRRPMGSLLWAYADSAAKLSADTITRRRMAPSPCAVEHRCRVRGGPRSLHQTLSGQPILDGVRDLGVVLVLYQVVQDDL